MEKLMEWAKQSQDMIQAVVAGFGATMAILAIEVFRKSRESGKRVPVKDFGFKALNALAAFMLVGAITFLQGDPVLRFLVRVLGIYGMRLLIAAMVVALGVFAHRWKRRNQRSYGFGEVIFGTVAGIFITFTLSPDHSILSQWIGLGGASYVIARGLNNMADGGQKALRSAATV
jgi:hypothetical protein